MPAERPSVPVMTRSTDSLPLATWGLMFPTRSGAPPVSQVTDEMTSECAFTKSSIIVRVSFWLPATSSMCRLTGADGFAGIVAPDLAAVCGAEPEFGAEQPVTTKAATATADAM